MSSAFFFFKKREQFYNIARNTDLLLLKPAILQTKSTVNYTKIFAILIAIFV